MVLGRCCFGAFLFSSFVAVGFLWWCLGLVLFCLSRLFCLLRLKKNKQTHSEHNMTAEAQTTGEFQDAGEGGSSWANRALCLIPGLRGYCA